VDGVADVRPEARPARGSAVVLVVEDEESLRTIIADLLSDLGSKRCWKLATGAAG
jgi:hypothetical protein